MAAARRRGLREKARRAHIKDYSASRARVSRSPPLAQRLWSESIFSSGRADACADSRGTRGRTRSLASRGHPRRPHPPPHRPQRAQGRCRAREAVHASRLRHVPVRRAPLPLAPPWRAFFPFLLADSRSFPPPLARRAAPNPPDASPRPHLTRRRRKRSLRAWFRPGRVVDRRTSAYSGQLRWQRERALHLQVVGVNARDGVGSSPTPFTATNSCVISASDLTRRA